MKTERDVYSLRKGNKTTQILALNFKKFRAMRLTPYWTEVTVTLSEPPNPPLPLGRHWSSRRCLCQSDDETSRERDESQCRRDYSCDDDGGRVMSSSGGFTATSLTVGAVWRSGWHDWSTAGVQATVRPVTVTLVVWVSERQLHETGH